ncbi:TlpA family protein disulfide reductase [Membranihabitans marinus]|uniref:TlpA family protein disulfide reductase n=1 Tax=Membranihabitans marinus TaxID=1227546 RepID=UPI001F38324D|nr:TlpA disulfide reductase family protein [Membranihabitans marinus]
MIFKRLIFFFIFFIPFFVVGQNLPLHQIQLKDIKGSRTTLQNALPKQKNIIISYWATWCGPCKKELDALKTNYAEWQDKYEVELLAISTDDARSAGKVRAMIQQRKWPYTIYIDTESTSKQVFNFETIPFTVVLDKTGNMVYSHIGYSNGDEAKLEAALQEIQ